MYQYTSIKHFISEFILAISSYTKAVSFIRKNRLWTGFAENKIVILALSILGILLGLRFIKVIQAWWSNVHLENPFDLGIHAASLVGNVFSESYQFFFAGSYKYLLLIIMELLIFHVAIRTNEILTGSKEKLTPSLFLNAQIRMIKISVVSYAMELIASFLISIGLSIIGMKFLKTPSIFLVQSFFLGFALIDNYNEIRGLKIKDSLNYTKNFLGASTGIGMVLYILMMVPVLGPVLGTMVGAVATILCMHQLEKKLPYADEIEHIEYV